MLMKHLNGVKTFVLVPNANGKVRLSLDLAWLNKVLTRPIYRGPTFNNILPRLAGVKYLMLIDASLVYQNVKLDKQHHT